MIVKELSDKEKLEVMEFMYKNGTVDQKFLNEAVGDLRGLSPKYNSITVDGTKLPSTDFDDRSTDLSMISQNVLEGID